MVTVCSLTVHNMTWSSDFIIFENRFVECCVSGHCVLTLRSAFICSSKLSRRTTRYSTWRMRTVNVYSWLWTFCALTLSIIILCFGIEWFFDGLFPAQKTDTARNFDIVAGRGCKRNGKPLSESIQHCVDKNLQSVCVWQASYIASRETKWYHQPAWSALARGSATLK